MRARAVAALISHARVVPFRARRGFRGDASHSGVALLSKAPLKINILIRRSRGRSANEGPSRGSGLARNARLIAPARSLISRREITASKIKPPAEAGSRYVGQTRETRLALPLSRYIPYIRAVTERALVLCVELCARARSRYADRAREAEHRTAARACRIVR